MTNKKCENKLYVFADDMAPHYLTAATQLDYDTMLGADKFGINSTEHCSPASRSLSTS
jgi:hypothetical protein